MKRSRFSLLTIRLVGMLNCVLALWGFWDFFDVILSDPFADYMAQAAEQGVPVDPAKFQLMFYLLSFITIPCHHVTIYLGVQLTRLKLKVFPLFVFISVVKTLLAACVFAMAWIKELEGYYVLAVVSTRDILSQVVFAFPFWGPMVVYRSAKKLGVFSRKARKHAWHSPRGF